jgi:hypothetical protein
MSACPSIGQSGGARVALDDLVDPLARERGAAPVDEHALLLAWSDEQRAATVEVGADRGQRAAWDRHEPFPGPVGVDAQHAGVEVKVALLERDRLRCADPARGQQFEQGAVAQRGRARSARLREQLVYLPAAEGLGAPLGKPRAGQRAR